MPISFSPSSLRFRGGSTPPSSNSQNAEPSKPSAQEFRKTSTPVPSIDIFHKTVDDTKPEGDKNVLYQRPLPLSRKLRPSEVRLMRRYPGLPMTSIANSDDKPKLNRVLKQPRQRTEERRKEIQLRKANLRAQQQPKTETQSKVNYEDLFKGLSDVFKGL